MTTVTTRIAALAAIALVLAACGATATGTGAPTAVVSSQPPVTLPPGASAPVDAAPSVGLFPIPSFDLSGLSTTLPVDSYRVAMSTGDVPNYESVVVTKPVVKKNVTTYDDAGNPETQMIISDQKVWVKDLPDGEFKEAPAQLAQAMLLAFDPGILLGAYTAVDWSHSSTDQGSETKNDIPARHLHVDASTFPGGAIAMPAGAYIDLWVADAGYIVAWEMTGFPAGQDIKIEVSHVDDPSNVVEEPS
jgi:hypothetical protein